MHTLTYAMGVIINYMGNYALKQVKFGAPLLSSMSIFTVSGWTEAHEKRSPIWGVWNAQQPQVYNLTGTRGSFWPAIFSQFMWFVSTYMALFTMFRLHHKVSLRFPIKTLPGNLWYEHASKSWWKLGLWCISSQFVFHSMFAGLPTVVGSSRYLQPNIYWHFKSINSPTQGPQGWRCMEFSG